LINRIVLVGRLTKDPELRYTPNGKAVAGFTLAVDRRFNTQEGDRETDFIDIVVWGKTAETCANHLTKGRLTGVEGRLEIRKFQTKDGQQRSKAEVVADNVTFLDRAKPGAAPARAAENPAAAPEDEFGPDIKVSDDDTPF
jgi:single-strand DNA-binding protein